MPCLPSITVVSKTRVYPEKRSNMADLKLSVSDLPMLSCHYIQKGGLFPRPPLPILSLLSLLAGSLSRALSLFPPLAGRLLTRPDGNVFLACNDAGADFLHASAGALLVRDVLGPAHVPVDHVGQFFALDRTVSYAGHSRPLLAVQVTELADGIFIGCSVNHAVTDGTSFWNFFNTFADCCRGVDRISRPAPDFSRDSVLISKSAVLRLPEGGPQVTFDVNAPLKEKIFSFTREAILKLKDRTNNCKPAGNKNVNAEILGKQTHDPFYNNVTAVLESWRGKNNVSVAAAGEISSFQSLCALLWGAVTRARKLPAGKTTTFRMAVNCRHRVKPRMEAFYFGNAIQSVPTQALAGDVVSKGVRWAAERLSENVKAHGDEAVRRAIAEWESAPRCFPLGNPDGASVTMGSSPRFPMYDNDFGWGRPLAVRSGRANKFDGKISAFPGRDGAGTVDLEVVLSPDTMAALESDSEFMQYVSTSALSPFHLDQPVTNLMDSIL